MNNQAYQEKYGKLINKYPNCATTYYYIKGRMKFSLNQKDLQRSLNYCQGVIEKRSTLPILSNI